MADNNPFDKFLKGLFGDDVQKSLSDFFNGAANDDQWRPQPQQPAPQQPPVIKRRTKKSSHRQDM